MVKPRKLNPPSVFEVEDLVDFLREREFKTLHAYTILGHLAKQLREGEPKFDKIPKIPKALHELLPLHFRVLSSKIVKKIETKDTTKLAIELQDGKQIESVIMRYDPKKAKDPFKPGHVKQGETRATLCVSSQVGCQMGCTFCDTGMMGLQGNLTSAEIFEQVVHAMCTTKIRNVVFMGMGEPLNNYRAVRESIKLMVDSRLFGLAPSHITVSTVGVTNRIRDLAVDFPKVNLAFSLHAPNQDLRLSIVPSGRAYPIQKLFLALRDWQESTGKKVFIEYVVLGDLNDKESQAHELGHLLISFGVSCMVNLIPWNPTEGGDMQGYHAPKEGNIKSFQRILRDQYNIRCTIRRELGQDINSACGQLIIKQSDSECSTIDDW